MTLGVASLVLYISAILFWNLLLKRNIGEAMVVSWVAVLLLCGAKIPELFLDSLAFAARQETIYASMAFVYMASIMKKTGMVGKMVEILNSIFGRISGGAGYVATAASALFGLISGSGSGNAASVGTITIPWMSNSGWTPRMAATVVSGNAGLGISFPPSSSMFLLLGLPVVAGSLDAGDLYVTLMCTGAWCLLYRILIIKFFASRDRVGAVPSEHIQPLGKSFATGWSSLLIFLGILIPVIITIGPLKEYLTAQPGFGKAGMRSVSIIVWIPVIVSWIAILEGRKRLPKTFKGWMDFNISTARSYALVGATIFFAFAAGRVMTKLGLGPDMSALLQSLALPKWGMLLLVGVIVTLVAGPLSSTATVVAVGSVAYTALTSLGIPPAIAAACFLVFASTEGASPPSAAPIFIASGLAQVDPSVTFKPLIFYYVIPTVIIGVFIGLGFLPVL